MPKGSLHLGKCSVEENEGWPKTTNHGDKQTFEHCVNSCNQQGEISACQYNMRTKSCLGFSKNVGKPDTSTEDFVRSTNLDNYCFVFK